MNIIKLSGVAAALSSVCVITSSTVANAQNAQNAQMKVNPKTCSSELYNLGAFSNDPSKAVKKALEAWDRLARQRGYFSFEAAKNPTVRVVVYTRSISRPQLRRNRNQGKWKANAIAYPCRFMGSLQRDELEWNDEYHD